MQIDVRRVEYADVAALRDLYRQEQNCQIIHDSILARGMADPYLILVDGRVGGYGGVWNRFDVGRVMEFYTLPELRVRAQPMFREFLAVSQATSIEAQTNVPIMLLMLCDFATDIAVANVLFEDAVVTSLPCPGGVFRHATPDDGDAGGEYVIEAAGAIVAAGGFLCHYNPPYGDVYMSVAESARRRGYGSYVVQEIKRVCYEAGRRPAARCNAGNAASRRTLEKAGFLPCGRLLTGRFSAP
jgi:GNAT superfamily N-acetyltransferase